jgi:GntR family transcriptional regulator
MVACRWEEIAAEVRTAIHQGHLKSGQKLPSCDELMGRYGIARATVQAAIEALRAEGLIKTKPGRGWFVSEPFEVVRLHRNSYAMPRRQDSRQGNGWTPDDTVTTVDFAYASAEISAELGVSPLTEVLVQRSNVILGGQVIQLHESYIPRPIPIVEAQTLEALLSSCTFSGTYDWLREAGHRVSVISERVRAHLPSCDEASLLGLPRRSPVLRIVRKVQGYGRCLEVTYVTMSAERFELVYELPGS